MKKITETIGSKHILSNIGKFALKMTYTLYENLLNTKTKLTTKYFPFFVNSQLSPILLSDSMWTPNL